MYLKENPKFTAKLKEEILAAGGMGAPLAEGDADSNGAEFDGQD